MTDAEIDNIKDTILREPPVDEIATGNNAIDLQTKLENSIVIKYKSGQFDQRKKGLLDTIKAVLPESNVDAEVEEVITIPDATDDEIKKIKAILINPVDQEEGELLEIPASLRDMSKRSNEILKYDGFKDMSEKGLEEFHDSHSLAMSVAAVSYTHL